MPLILPIILGHVALGQIRRTHEEGRGMALAAVILGWIFLASFVLFVGLALIAAGESNTPGVY